jgi:hypothetical protein
MLSRSDWNLLVLAAAEGASIEPVQLQKSLFLLGKAFPQAVAGGGFYDFQPYNYGAFDATVYGDVEQMQEEGLASVTRSAAGWNEYAATPAGLARAKALQPSVDPKVLDYIRRVVDWARRLSFSDLVRAVYKAYPETKVNSIFKGSA